MRKMEVDEEQVIQLRILKLVDKICKENNIHYYLAYGTLLGAVRSGGFIPWDDDVDLWMTRNDIPRFIRVFENYNNSQYFLQTEKTDKKNINPEMIRICVNNTYKWPKGNEKESFHTGLYLDVFPLDNAYGDYRDRIDLALHRRLHMCMWRTLNGYYPNSLREKITTSICKTVNRNVFKTIILHIIKRHEREAASERYICFSPSYRGRNLCLLDKKYFEDVSYFGFEGINAPCPGGYGKLLAQIYGDDYMTPKMTKPEIMHAYYI